GKTQLEDDPAGLHVRDPPLGGALTRPHTSFLRFLRQRTIRKNVDPDLAATLHVPGHRDTSRLDLSVRHVGLLERLDPVVTKADLGGPLRRTGTFRSVRL